MWPASNALRIVVGAAGLCLVGGTGCQDDSSRSDETVHEAKPGLSIQMPGEVDGLIGVVVRRDGSAQIAFVDGIAVVAPDWSSVGRVPGGPTPEFENGFIDAAPSASIDAWALVRQPDRLLVTTSSSTESPQWRRIETGDETPTAVAWLDSDSLIWGGGGRVVRQSLEAPNETWIVEVSFDVTGVSASERDVFAWSLNGDVVSLAADTGALQWQADVPDIERCAGPLGDGRLVCLDYFGGVTAVDARTGRVEEFAPRIDGASAIAVHRSPEVVVVGTDSGAIYAVTGNAARLIHKMRSAVSVIGVAPDGRYAVACDAEGVVSRILL